MTTTTKVKTGWVLHYAEGVGDNLYVDERDFLGPLNDAEVFSSRNKARTASSRVKGSDIVRKVELSDVGNAVKIIPGR